MVTSGCFLSLERSVFVLAPRSMPPRCTLKKMVPFCFWMGDGFPFQKTNINFYVVLRLPSAQVCESCDPQIDGIQHQLEADLLLARGCFSLYGDEARGDLETLCMEGMQWIIIRLLLNDLDLFPPQSKKPST